MAYLVYNTETSIICTLKAYGKQAYATEAAAKAAMTRMIKAGRIPADKAAVSDTETFWRDIDKKVEKVNLISGKTYWESVNTPGYCSPSTETYWSM